jgi:hypothetical protein
VTDRLYHNGCQRPGLDLVTSLQFHDIKRQQVEHIVGALRKLRGGNPDSPPKDAQVIISLQSAQLAGTAATFASSIERMERDLEA